MEAHRGAPATVTKGVTYGPPQCAIPPAIFPAGAPSVDAIIDALATSIGGSAPRSQLKTSEYASSAWALAQLGEAGEALSRLREGEQLVERQAARGVSVREHLATATTMYREMDMTFWLEQAGREMAACR